MNVTFENNKQENEINKFLSSKTINTETKIFP